MLTYSMDDRKNNSLYDYLYKCIKRDIMSGKLVSGQKLPSKRNFAKNLGVSVITIENAYSQLAAEGFIFSVEKKGYFVAKIGESVGKYAETITASDCGEDERAYNANGNNQSCRKLSEQFAENEGTKKCAIESDVPTKIDFVSNIVNFDKFPFSTWSKLTREILSEQDEGLLRSAPVKGILELRQSIADYLYNFRGLNVTPERIVIGSGTEYLYGILVQLLGRDKIYAMEDPGYSKVMYVLTGNGVKCSPIPMDEYGMNIESLNESRADIVHLTPSHHFPTGIVMPIQRRLELLEWAYGKEDRYLIEDDYDCEFRLQGRPIQTMSEIDARGKVIYINTFSKTLAPSLRISYMVLPNELMDRFESMMGYMSCTVPNLEQYVLARFMGRGYFERHINRMRVFYRGIRDELLGGIKESNYGSKVKIMEENSGLHFLVKIRSNMSDEALVRRASACGLKIACLSDYEHTPNLSNRHVIIVNYSGMSSDNIPEAVKLLGEVIDN